MLNQLSQLKEEIMLIGRYHLNWIAFRLLVGIDRLVVQDAGDRIMPIIAGMVTVRLTIDDGTR
jgi:hypothetical protein